jgi:diguanylate cyclase (GGDEF)-like protein
MSSRMRYSLDSSARVLESGPLPLLLGFEVLAFAAAAMNPSGTDWAVAGFAAVLALLLAVAAAVVPWRRIGATFLVFPAVGALGLVAILRESAGGAISGYGPLAILPVLWVAFVLGRRAVVLTSFVAALVFVLPIVLVGGPRYPESTLRLAVLWSVVITFVGLVSALVVAAQRRHAARAEAQAFAAAETLRALEGVASVARDISCGADARDRVCEAAMSGTGATIVTVMEPRAEGFAITAAAGLSRDLQELVLPMSSPTAYASQQRVFIADVADDANVSRIIIEATGTRSVLFEPILRAGASVGVLGVGWATQRDHVDAKDLAVISYLAAEAGAAIERSDLLARLDRQARTDELTSLANRRRWDEKVAEALTIPRRLCVAMIDIDHFKAFNDAHGHIAGDELLRACANEWSQKLRPGDLIARYGGEEFAVLLHDCTLVDARRALERLRHATPRGITCSLGVTERHPGDSPEAFIARADDALYHAKRAGRNRLKAA